MKEVQDYYFKKAKKDKYVARSAYKLEEIQKKHKILRKGQNVMDLGCFPGSWLQYVSKVVGSDGLVLGVDLQDMKMQLPKNARFIHGDINELDLNQLGEEISRFDVIVSDMAPKTTGIKSLDAERSLQLCEMALYVADKFMKSSGSVVVKVFQGAPLERLLKKMRAEYQKVAIVKPKSSRNESVEVFVVGMRKKQLEKPTE